MSWLTSARVALERWGSPSRFAIRQIVANAFPGGSLVVELMDQLLEAAEETAKDLGELEKEARAQASEEELKRVGEVLDEVNGRLSPLVEQVVHLEGLPDAADRIIRASLATQEDVRAGFARLAGLVARFDRIEEQGREILRKVGYGNDVLETILTLMHRQSVVVEFVEELRAAGVQPRPLGEALAMMTASLAATRAGQVAEAMPKLRALEAERPESATVQLTLAVGASLNHDLRAADRALTKATRLRPNDVKLADLGRRVTQASNAQSTPTPPISGSTLKPPGLNDVIDAWTLTRLLGQGGWGQVYRAERNGHKRALKLLHPELSLDPAFEENFKREIMALASLGDQPYLVKFDTFGYVKPHGTLYFLMELIEGESLQTRLERRGPLSPAEAVPLFRQVAGEGGLATVHAKKMAHRDVKPANLLLRAHDNSPVMVDFGLALAGSRGLSTINHMTGYTAMFAAPEQLRGKPADARSDVYSLVGTLFYALTLQEPEEFEPSHLAKELEPLREVFTRALDRRPASRPADAGELATLLDCIPLRELAKRAAGTETSDKPQAPAVIVRRKNVLLPKSPPGLERGGTNAVILLALADHSGSVSSVSFSPDGRLLATACTDNVARLWSVPDGKSLAILSGHSNSLRSVSFSPDGRTLATACADHTAQLWSVPDGQSLATLSGHSGSVSSVSFSPDGRFLATGSDDKTARLWSVPDGTLLVTLSGHSDWVRSVSFSPDGRTLATGNDDKTIRLWNVPDGRLLATLSGHSNYVFTVSFSPDGRLLASGCNDGTVQLWSVPDGTSLATLSAHSACVFSVSFSPDGRLLVTGSDDKTARLWSVPDGTPLATLSGLSGSVTSISFSPDGRLLATGSGDKTAVLWLLHSLGESIDWTLPDRSSLPPRAATTLLRAGEGIAYPGDFLWGQLAVENSGKGDMARTWAEVRSASTFLDGLMTVLGRIEPGKTVERCLATMIPPETAPGEVLGELVFHEANGYAPAARPLAFTIAPLPRPDFPLTWEFVNDGSGNSHGKGDGRPKRGEYIDVSVSVENQIGEDLEWLNLSLKLVEAPAGVRVTGGRHDLGPLADGGSVTGRVGFCIEANAKPGQAKFELRVENKDGRTFAVVPVETNIG
jgi:WD40 repeat protein